MTSEEIGSLIREARKFSHLTQREVARGAGTGLRFVIELEQGKPTCHLGKVLAVMAAVGITQELHPPAEPIRLQKTIVPIPQTPSASGAGWDNTFLD